MIRDYWVMDNDALEDLARKYHIILAKGGTIGINKDGDVVVDQEFFDRSRIITELVARDMTRQGNWSLVLSITSLVASFVAIIISVAAR